MNPEDVRTLFDYNDWANRRVCDACATLTPEQFTRDLGSSFRSLRDTLAHTMGGEWLWLERWRGRAPKGIPPAGDFPTLAALRARWDEIGRDLKQFVAGLRAEDLPRTITYHALDGKEYSQPLWHLLQHLANHATYHRGQTATMLRQLGAKPAPTDLVVFYRERAAATL